MSAFQLMPALSDEEYAALRDDIEARGVLVPVEIDADTGEVLDGHHRLRIAAELGVEAPTFARSFASDEERIEHVLSLNLMRRHLTTDQRARLVAELRKQGWSLRRIAERLDVAPATALRDLRGVSNETPAAITGLDDFIDRQRAS
ncbi:MAG: ParB N-terminal domain-containing protein [Gemmatimonadaceae bacterium]|nr:ParB N-terminal domain-containing protein [Gemmatimonadaceae bacterium]